jgi:hypothetical protein
MTSAARKIDDGAATQETVTVIAVDGDDVVVQTASGRRTARRAVGCLLCPAEGDLVLAASSRLGYWVLAVLERDDGAAGRLRYEGDLSIELPRGRLGVSSGEGVDVVAPSVMLHAAEGTVAVERLSLLGGVVEVDVARAHLVAHAIEQTVERFTQRARRVVRFVEEFEEVRAGRLDLVAKSLLSLRGREAIVTADGLAKVDGAQVHIG